MKKNKFQNQSPKNSHACVPLRILLSVSPIFLFLQEMSLNFLLRSVDQCAGGSSGLNSIPGATIQAAKCFIQIK
jgi:hypothetical protein